MQRLDPKAETLEDAGAEVIDQDVGVVDTLLEHPPVSLYPGQFTGGVDGERSFQRSVDGCALLGVGGVRRWSRRRGA